MRSNLISFCCLAVFAACCCFAEAIIKNGDFEIVSANQHFPDRWNIIQQGGCSYVQTNDSQAAGNRCLIFDLQGQTTRIETRPGLREGRHYRLSIDLKTEGFEGAAGVYITPMQWNWSRAITIPNGSADWSRKQLDFSLPAEKEPAYRLILFAKKGARGKIWFDNVDIQPLMPVESQSEPYISAGKIRQAIKLDGELQDLGWQDSLEITPFIRLGDYQHSVFANEGSVFRIGYDEKNLYVAFRCRQLCLEPMRNELDNFRVNVSRHDGDMWNQDCVLILLKTEVE